MRAIISTVAFDQKKNFFVMLTAERDNLLAIAKFLV